MPIRVKFNTKRLKREIRKNLDRALRTASHELADALQAEVSTPGPTRSRPGSPPHRQTGRLHDSIQPATPPEHGVEINAPYAAHLERGTVKMLPRPYVLPALLRKRRDLESLLKRTIRIR